MQEWLWYLLREDLQDLKPWDALNQELHIVPSKEVCKEGLLVNHSDYGTDHVEGVICLTLFADYAEISLIKTL